MGIDHIVYPSGLSGNGEGNDNIPCWIHGYGVNYFFVITGHAIQNPHSNRSRYKDAVFFLNKKAPAIMQNAYHSLLRCKINKTAGI